MVYVDGMNAKFRNMTMCHMMADSHEELVAMADKIGVKRKWIQYEGLYSEHFDICLSKKKLAIENGAIEVGWREIGKLLEDRLSKSDESGHYGR